MTSTPKSRRIIHGITSKRAAPPPAAPEILAIGDDADEVAGRVRAVASTTVRVDARNLERFIAALDTPRAVKSDLVVMSRATLDALLDRIDDEAAIAANKRAAGQERVPFEVVKRLVAGEHPVRVWREHRDRTLEQIAEKARLSISYLSEIEKGKKPGSLKILRAIAGALELDLDDLTVWLRN